MSKSFFPYVSIRVAFAANNLKSHLFRFSKRVGGKTEISAPVSIKNCRFVTMSTTIKRQFCFWGLLSPTAQNDEPTSFPNHR